MMDKVKVDVLLNMRNYHGRIGEYYLVIRLYELAIHINLAILAREENEFGARITLNQDT